MQALQISVDVVMERVPLASLWQSETWRPFAVVPSLAAEDAVGACIALDAEGHRWRFPGHVIELHPVEAEGYFLNLTSPAPCVFVMWRTVEGSAPPPVRPVLVTVSYNEAGRLMDGGERVGSVAMPGGIADWVRPFVAEHYKPEPRRKVKRNDPFAEGAFVRSPRGAGPERS